MTSPTLPAELVSSKANVYFDGRCVSYDVRTAEGLRKSVGVIFPGDLTFGTSQTETLECVEGSCEYQLEEGGPWRLCAPGQSFQIPAQSRFNIRVTEIFHYICHYG